MSFGLVFLLTCAFILLYILAIYPALLAVGIFSKAPPPRTGPGLKTISVILAVRDGEAWIGRKLKSLLELDYPGELLEILVISDGSTDRTEEIAREYADSVKLLCIPPSGKATAINRGVAEATGELLFFTDVRQRLDQGCLKALVPFFADPTVGVASGELFIGEGTAEESSVGLYWRLEKWIRKRHAEIDSVLGATGAIYMMRRSLAVPLPAETLVDDVHLPMVAFLGGYRLIFVDKAKAYDVPTDTSTEFRRKVRTLAGVYQLIRRFPRLLLPSNRMWIHFLSHKFGRLLLPFALLGILFSSFSLSRPWMELALAAQAVFYGLAAADRWIPDAFPGKRFSSVIRAFVVMMMAALVASTVLFRPGRAFWKSQPGGERVSTKR